MVTLLQHFCYYMYCPLHRSLDWLQRSYPEQNKIHIILEKYLTALVNINQSVSFQVTILPSQKNKKINTTTLVQNMTGQMFCATNFPGYHNAVFSFTSAASDPFLSPGLEDVPLFFLSPCCKI